MFLFEFRKERTMLDSILAKDAVIVPYKGILKACAMYLPVNCYTFQHPLTESVVFEICLTLVGIFDRIFGLVVTV